MAVIDKAQILLDTYLYLPDSNVLSDEILNSVITNVVDFQIPDDDDIYYSEALCKTLRAAALLNKGKFAVDGSRIKKEKVGNMELENQLGSSGHVWDDYLKSLQDICPFLPGGGYRPPKAIGIKINPGDKFVVNDCEYLSELTL